MQPRSGTHSCVAQGLALRRGAVGVVLGHLPRAQATAFRLTVGKAFAAVESVPYGASPSPESARPDGYVDKGNHRPLSTLQVNSRARSPVDGHDATGARVVRRSYAYSRIAARSASDVPLAPRVTRRHCVCSHGGYHPGRDSAVRRAVHVGGWWQAGPLRRATARLGNDAAAGEQAVVALGTSTYVAGIVRSKTAITRQVRRLPGVCSPRD